MDGFLLGFMRYGKCVDFAHEEPGELADLEEEPEPDEVFVEVEGDMVVVAYGLKNLLALDVVGKRVIVGRDEDLLGLEVVDEIDESFGLGGVIGADSSVLIVEEGYVWRGESQRCVRLFCQVASFGYQLFFGQLLVCG